MLTSRASGRYTCRQDHGSVVVHPTRPVPDDAFITPSSHDVPYKVTTRGLCVVDWVTGPHRWLVTACDHVASERARQTDIHASATLSHDVDPETVGRVKCRDAMSTDGRVSGHAAEQQAVAPLYMKPPMPEQDRHVTPSGAMEKPSNCFRIRRGHFIHACDGEVHGSMHAQAPSRWRTEVNPSAGVHPTTRTHRVKNP